MTYARRLNATLLYHPLLPNQAEHQLFERYFGFGYPEPFRLFDACVRGVVGEACEVFLPCLKVRRVSERGRWQARLLASALASAGAGWARD